MTTLSRSRLDQELVRRGWTANDLALAAGVSAGTLSGARHGRPVAPRTLRKIALALSKAPVVAGIEELLEPRLGTEGRTERVGGTV